MGELQLWLQRYWKWANAGQYSFTMVGIYVTTFQVFRSRGQGEEVKEWSFPTKYPHAATESVCLTYKAST